MFYLIISNHVIHFLWVLIVIFICELSVVLYVSGAISSMDIYFRTYVWGIFYDMLGLQNILFLEFIHRSKIFISSCEVMHKIWRSLLITICEPLWSFIDNWCHLAKITCIMETLWWQSFRTQLAQIVFKSLKMWVWGKIVEMNIFELGAALGLFILLSKIIHCKCWFLSSGYFLVLLYLSLLGR